MTLVSDAGTGIRGGGSATLSLTVTDVATVAADVRHVRFADPSGAPLPSFTPPGSHVVLSCGDNDGRPPATTPTR